MTVTITAAHLGSGNGEGAGSPSPRFRSLAIEDLSDMADMLGIPLHDFVRMLRTAYPRT